MPRPCILGTASKSIPPAQQGCSACPSLHEHRPSHRTSFHLYLPSTFCPSNPQQELVCFYSSQPQPGATTDRVATTAAAPAFIFPNPFCCRVRMVQNCTQSVPRPVPNSTNGACPVAQACTKPKRLACKHLFFQSVLAASLQRRHTSSSTNQWVMKQGH